MFFYDVMSHTGSVAQHKPDN